MSGSLDEDLEIFSGRADLERGVVAVVVSLNVETQSIVYILRAICLRILGQGSELCL